MISRIILSIINFFKFFDSSFSIKNKSQKEANKIQLNLLNKLISKSKHTKFGVDHNFENIKNLFVRCAHTVCSPGSLE